MLIFPSQPRQKQVEIDQLKYELNAQRRRDQSEIGALNQRVGELEIQLVEARKEADEYYKATLERNMEVTSLHQQVKKIFFKRNKEFIFVTWTVKFNQIVITLI